MNENIERDTQFAGFAKLLFDELPEQNSDFHPNWEEETMKVIARRAYDLAVYVIHMHTAIERPGMVFTPADILREMPDMTALPEERKRNERA